MHLTPREIDKLLVLSLAEVAQRRREKGLKLNHPEAVAVITATALEGARAGKTVEEVMNEARKALTRDDVMEGVPEQAFAALPGTCRSSGERAAFLYAFAALKFYQSYFI